MIGKILWHYYMAKTKLVKLNRMFTVPRGKKVIDIGGGDGPFPRADVVCEKFLGDDSERTNTFHHDRPLVMGDLEALPFTDKAFDFVYCSHILEHAKDPTKAIKEITRIGSAGYIEVPSEYLELAATSTPAHLWTIIRGEKGQLIFRPKTSAAPNPHVDLIFKNDLWMKDSLYMAFHWKNYYRLFNIGLTWNHNIPHEIEKGPTANQGNGFLKGQVESLQSIRKVLERSSKSSSSFWDPRKWIKRGIRSFYSDPTIKDWLMSHIACPACAKKIETTEESSVVCQSCQMKYPLVEGVPILLKEHGNILGKVLNT